MPYSVIADGVLYMMYGVGFIVSLKLDSGEFSVLRLPPQMLQDSGTDYRVARSGTRGLCIIRVRGAELQHWDSDMAGGSGSQWRLRRTIYLPYVLEGTIGSSFLEKIIHGPPFLVADESFYAATVRCAGDNGSTAVITFGFSPRIFFLDLEKSRSYELMNMVNQHLMTSVFQVNMPWDRIVAARQLIFSEQ
jgi:hypothetical protein